METYNFIHPAFVFLAAALLVICLPGFKYWKWVLLLAPVIAIYSMLTAPAGTYMVWEWAAMSPPPPGDLAEAVVKPITITLGRVDKLSLIFGQVFAVMALAGLLYGMHVNDKAQIAAALLYVTGGFGCVFAGDFLTLFIFWELMSIGSTFLVMLSRTRESVLAGFRYFLYHTAGGLFLLAGLLLRYHAVGSFDFGPIAHDGAQVYDWLILLGFCVNAAVVPLHAWLPDAYPRGTVIGSVFMCAYTTKTAVYVLMRGFPGWEILAVAGTIMALYGVFYACMENNARRILSYHIISQVGYMVAGIGVGAAMTLNGASAHAYAHILYKGLLFMGAGAVLYSCGTAKLDQLGGLAARLPWVMILYMVAALSISGMPLFNGFVSKTMTIAGAAEAHWTWVAFGLEVAAVGTFISVGIKLPYFAFWGGKQTDWQREIKPIPWNMYAGMSVLALLCIAQGLFPERLLYAYLPEAVDHQFVPWTAWNVVQSASLLGFAGLAFYLMRKVLTPHAGLNLDFDYFYRLIGRGALALICRPIAVIDNLWTEAYRVIGLRGLMDVAFGSAVFDKKGIDTVVDGSAYTVQGIGRLGALMQNGKLQEYIGLMVVFALIIFGLLWFWG